MALQRRPELEVRLWARRSEAVEEARTLKVASLVTGDLREAVRGADTVLLCVPVGAMPQLVQAALPELSPDALVTDVGSVKGPVCAQLAPLLEGRALFVGSHPMAGSEKAGIHASRPDLYSNALCILTPEPGRTPIQAIQRADEFWHELGCRTRLLTPEAHDRVCAFISHLPHLTAAVLVNVVEAGCPEAFDFCGPGFRDTTRVAAGLAGMWTEILSSNREAVSASLRGLISHLEEAAALLESGGPEAEAGINRLLASARARREGLWKG
jgi:prephenate dehydrogenase